MLLTSLCLCAGLFGPFAGVASAKAPEKSSGAGTETYLPMNPATGVIPRRDGRRSTLTVEIGLDVPDAVLRERAILSKPRLTAGFNEVVRNASRSLLPGRVPDLDALTRLLQTQADQILGKPGAKVLLGSVIVH